MIILAHANFPVHNLLKVCNVVRKLTLWLRKIIRKLHQIQQNATPFYRFERTCCRYAPGSHTSHKSHSRLHKFDGVPYVVSIVVTKEINLFMGDQRSFSSWWLTGLLVCVIFFYIGSFQSQPRQKVIMSTDKCMNNRYETS